MSINCDVVLRMNKDIIYLNIIDNEFYYSDKDLNNCDVGESIEYYSINKIYKNMILYKKHEIIKCIKNMGEDIFKNDLLVSLNDNLTEDIKERLKWGLCHIEYELDESKFVRID